MATTIETGATAERGASQVFARAGYDIVEMNFRCKVGEIDIIARRGDLLVFVEVRSRGDGRHGQAAEMVYPSKQRQVAKVASYYLALRRPEFRRVRFDVVAITGGELEWIEDAWRL